MTDKVKQDHENVKHVVFCLAKNGSDCQKTNQNYLNLQYLHTALMRRQQHHPK